MRNEKIGQAKVALKLGEEIYDLRANTDVERGDGFIGHDELWTQCESSGDADALALSSAEFVRKAAEDGLIQADGAEQFGDSSFAVACGTSSRHTSVPFGTTVNDQRLGNDVFDAEAGIERGEWILKDDLHVAAQTPHFARVRCEQVKIFEANTAGGRLDQAQDQAPQRALAGAGFPDQSEGLARMNVERDAFF